METLITSQNITDAEIESARIYLNNTLNTKGKRDLATILSHARLELRRSTAEINSRSNLGYVDEHRVCNPYKNRTQMNDILLVDPDILQTFDKPAVSLTCFYECPFGTMQHAGTSGEGKRRILCNEHANSLQLILDTVRLDHDERINDIERLQDNSRRFMRSPNMEYLCKILNVDASYYNDNYLFEKLVNSQGRLNPEYLYCAITSTCHLYSNLASSLHNTEKFRECIDIYGELGAHGNRARFIRTTNDRSRKIQIPKEIIDPIYNIINNQPITSVSSYTEHFDSKTDIEYVIEEIQKRTIAVYNKSRKPEARLDNAYQALYVMERSWIWFNGHHSRCMQYFNVLLEEIGKDPMPHGFIDYAAHALDYPGFKKYMEYLIQIDK